VGRVGASSDDDRPGTRSVRVAGAVAAEL
jgi:hypothetical protein